MRLPLLVLVLTYSIAILGMVVIPGQDAQGNLWYMDFFHAVYFVSFMSTTIGFGEIPYELSDAQRIWVIVCIYSTVVAWIYSIGALIALFRDETLHRVLIERHFAKLIRRMHERFYLICGYGETGCALVEALTERDYRAVVVEVKQECVNLLKMANLREYVPALCADAGRPVHLLEAGLNHPLCAGVVALTNVNEVNLKIAITSKLLNEKLTVICRADSQDVEKNMASFGTDYIIDPFQTFALHLATAFQSPGLHLLQEWLTGLSRSKLTDPIYPPNNGHWVVCGFGRFGKAVYRCLKQEGVATVVIEAHPERTGAPDDRYISGRGTEAITLQEARIENAVGLVAGTSDDTDNLSIVMTALELNSDLFVVLRQNLIENQALIDAVHTDMVMHPSRIIANRIRVLLGTPLLHEFIQLAKFNDDAWACELISRILALINVKVPEVWEVELTTDATRAVCNAISSGRRVTVGQVMTDPRERTRTLPCIALLLMQGGSRKLLPAPETPVENGDRMLFCGRYSARINMEWILQNEHALSYVLTGETRPQGLVWRFFERIYASKRTSP